MEFKQLIDMPYYTKNQVMEMKKDELVESYMFLQGGYQVELDAASQSVENARYELAGQLEDMDMPRREQRADRIVIDGLKEEISVLRGKLECANKNADAEEHNKQAGIILEENDRLQEELSNLKYDLEELQDNNEYHEAGYYKFKEEIEKLKEENKKLSSN